jgi:hypothetical protein
MGAGDKQFYEVAYRSLMDRKKSRVIPFSSSSVSQRLCGTPCGLCARCQPINVWTLANTAQQSRRPWLYTALSLKFSWPEGRLQGRRLGIPELAGQTQHEQARSPAEAAGLLLFSLIQSFQ